MAKPDAHLDWLEGNGDVESVATEPLDALKLAGFAPNVKPTSQNFNYLLRTTDLWNKWSEEQIDAINEELAEPAGGVEIGIVAPSNPVLTIGAAVETTFRSGSITSNALSVAYGAGTYVAVVAFTKLAYSFDGVTWVLADLTALSVGSQFNEVRFLNNLFVCVGDEDLILTSSDGITWAKRTPPALAFTYRIRGVGYGNGKFATVGQKRCLSSVDGITWIEETQSIDGPNLISIDYGAGLWVAVGASAGFSDGAFYSSPDLVTWTLRTNAYGGSQQIERVRFHNSRFVATGRGQGARPTAVYSDNGTSWTATASGVVSGQNRGITFANGTWFISNGDSPGKILKSVDNAVTWTVLHTSTINDYFYDIISGENEILAVTGPAASTGPYAISLPLSVSPIIDEGTVYIDSATGNVYQFVSDAWALKFKVTVATLEAVFANVESTGQLWSTRHSIVAPGSTETIDWNSGNVQTLPLDANCTLTLSNPKDGAGYVLIVKQDATGSRTITWPAAVKWPAGTPAVLSTAANSIDVVSLLWDGTNYYANIAKAFA